MNKHVAEQPGTEIGSKTLIIACTTNMIVIDYMLRTVLDPKYTNVSEIQFLLWRSS